MLVLTRKTNQQIQIGDNITITIVRVKGNAVRIGIDAPRDERVLRTELNDRASATSKSSQPMPAVTLGLEAVAVVDIVTNGVHQELGDEGANEARPVPSDKSAGPLGNRVRMLSSQTVRYPQPLGVGSLRTTFGRG